MVYVSYVLFVFFLPVNLDASPSHEFHLSKCDIIYNHEEKALQLTLHIFIDDLELALSQDSADTLFLCTKKENPLAEARISEYIRNHLVLNIDGQKTDLSYVGKEISDDLSAVWCYFEIVNATPVQTIDIEYDLLIETYSDQRNIVKIIYDEDRKAYFLFDSDKTTGQLSLQ